MKNGETFEHFLQVVKWFQESRYRNVGRVDTLYPEIYADIDIKTSNDCCTAKDHDQYSITTNTLLLSFCNAHDPKSENANAIYINGCITFENMKIFDKFRNTLTPNIKFPNTKEEFEALLKVLEFVETDEYINDFDNSDIDDDTYDKMYGDAFEAIEQLIIEEF